MKSILSICLGLGLLLLSGKVQAQFEFVSSFPEANEINVPPSAIIMLSFSSSVFINAANSDNIQIRGNLTGLIPGEFSGGGSNKITFRPFEPFKTGEVITVDISSTFRSTFLQNLEEPVHFEFRIAVEPGLESPPFFQERPITTTASAPILAKAADMDADGDIDVIAAYAEDERIVWLENRGKEVFEERIISTQSRGLEDFQIVDMNQDGLPDILYVSSSPSKLSWLQNDRGRFIERVVNNKIEELMDVFAIDLDIDGDMDIVSVSKRDDNIFWFENRGNEEFVGKVVTTGFKNPITIYVADLNSDNHLDVIFGIEEGGIFAAFNDSRNNFIPPSQPLGEVEGLNELLALDFNLDDEVDILAATNDEGIVIFRNQGRNKFTKILANIDEPIQARTVDVQDVDGDNDLDILTGAFFLDKVIWYEQNGSFTFVEKVVSIGKEDADEPTSVFAVDMEQDGDMDILASFFRGNKIAWYANVFRDDPPFVANPLAPLSVLEDAAPASINLSQVFDDPDSDKNKIVKSILSNNNPGLVKAGINGNNLSLSFTSNASGTAQLIIRGTSGGGSANAILNIEVKAIDDAPTVLNPLSDLSVPFATKRRKIFLGNLFDDIDSPNKAIVKTVENQPDGALLSTNIRNDSLIINFQSEVVGTTQIVIKGESPPSVEPARDTVQVTIRLPAPISLSANPISNQEIILNWNYSDNLSNISFQIQRSFTPNFASVTNLGTTTERSFTDNVSNDVLHYYRVRALRGSDASAFSTSAAARPVNVPPAPSALQAQLQDNGTVLLNWLSTATNANSLRLERASPLTDNNFEEIASFLPNVSSALDSGLQGNLTYRYRIRASNNLGSSPYSNIASVSIPKDSSIAPPLAPLNLEAQAISTRQINLSWDYDLDSTTLFIIERVEGEVFIEGIQDTIASIPNDEQQRLKKFSDAEDIVANNFYTYRVIALNIGGGTPSNTATAQALCSLEGVIAVVRVGNSSGRICEDKSLPLEVVPLIDEADYQWLRNGEPIEGANSRRFLAKQTGRYSCIVQVDVCNDTTIINEDVVFDGTSPELTIRLDGNILRADRRDAITYQWFRNLEPIVGADQSFYNPQENGQYYVVATFGTGSAACQAISNTLIFPEVVTSLGEDISNFMQLDPNPSQGEMHFRLSASFREAYQIKLYNLQGQTVYTYQGQKTGELLEQLIDVRHLVAGTYIFEFRTPRFFGKKIWLKY